jgi:hypothetical protein
MSSQALREGRITEQAIINALITSRGDLFLAASYLSVRPRELDSYLRASEDLQGFVTAIAQVKRNVDYERMSAAQFREQLEHLTTVYRVDGLAVIHELATMGFDSAAMADVKLKAAVQLMGSHKDASAGGTQAAILDELNQLYREGAPRIKSLRAAIQVDFE